MPMQAAVSSVVMDCVNVLQRSEEVRQLMPVRATYRSPEIAQQRKRAAEQLGKFYSPEAAAALADVVCDGNERVKAIAHDSLERFGTNAVPCLTEKLDRTRDYHPRRALVSILAKIGDPSAANSLLKIVDWDTSFVVKALARLNYTDPKQKQDVVSTLSPRLFEKEGADIANAFRIIKDPSAAKYLVQAAKDPKVSGFKEVMLASLGELDYKGERTLKRSVFEFAISALNDHSYAAPVAIAMLAHQETQWSLEAMEAFEGKFKPKEDQGMAARIVKALSIGDFACVSKNKAELVDSLLQVLTFEGEEATDAAADVLWQMGPAEDGAQARKISAGLLEAFRNRSAEDKFPAARALAEFNGESFVPVVFERMRQMDLTDFENHDFVKACTVFLSSVEYSSEQSKEAATEMLASFFHDFHEPLESGNLGTTYPCRLMNCMLETVEKIGRVTPAAVNAIAACLDINTSRINDSYVRRDVIAIMEKAASSFQNLSYANEEAAAAARLALRERLSNGSSISESIAGSLRKIGTGQDLAFLESELAFRGATLPAAART